MPYDFVAVKSKYEKLSKKDKAALGRVNNPAQFPTLGATYKLIPSDEKPDTRWQRVLFLLPLVEHQTEGLNLGALFAQAQIKERHIQDIVSSSFPNMLIYIANCLKLCKQNNKVDFQKVGELLFYWGDKNREQFLQDFYRNIPIPQKEVSLE